MNAYNIFKKRNFKKRNIARQTGRTVSVRVAVGVALGSALGLTVSACSPIVNVRGYVPEQDKVEKLAVGQQNKDEVYTLLGSPSTLATFSEDTWYYISSRTERIGFFEPKTVDRTVLAVKFDDDEKVSNIAKYGLEDGRVVNFVDRTTPTRGKELTFLEQMFGNIGAVPTGMGSEPPSSRGP